MVPPDPGDLVEHRLIGMRIGNHQPHREIRCDEGIGQRGEGEGEQEELCGGRGLPYRHPRAPAFLGTDEGNDHLQDGHHEGEDEGEVAKLYKHGGDHMP